QPLSMLPQLALNEAQDRHSDWPGVVAGPVGEGVTGTVPGPLGESVSTSSKSFEKSAPMRVSHASASATVHRSSRTNARLGLRKPLARIKTALSTESRGNRETYRAPRGERHDQ